MNAEILCIGTELLIGQVVNTNATYLARELADIGVDLYWITTVGDNFGRLGEALTTAMGRADLVLVSGGLGPTADDITIEAIARWLGEEMAERDEVRDHIIALFARRKRPMALSNFKQALFPPSAAVIPNPAGSAYGVHVTRDGHQLMAFPGVPMELKAMWTDWARPRLAGHGLTIQSTLLRYVGIGEAALAEQVAHWLAGENPTVAPYAGDAEVHLRVTAKAASRDAAEALMAPVVAELQAIAPYYYGQDDETLPAVVGRLLKTAGQFLATAESCTGGLLASRLTDVAGSGGYFRGGEVAYATELKASRLEVPMATIAAAGVVSQAVVTEMARRVRGVLQADWGVATTGYADAGPDVPADEVGLVWIAVAGPGEYLAVMEWRFGGLSRAVIKQRASQAALEMLRLALISGKVGLAFNENP